MKGKKENGICLPLKMHEPDKSHSNKGTEVWILDRECGKCRSSVKQFVTYVWNVRAQIEVTSWLTRCPICKNPLEKPEPGEVDRAIAAILSQAVTEAVQVIVDPRTRAPPLKSDPHFSRK